MKRLMRVMACVALFWIGVVHAGTMYYDYTDPQGNVLAVADAQGHVVARYDYAPYGAPVVLQGSAPNGPGYTGQVNDPETGLIYMQQRYYAPVGRFPSPDPVGPVPGNVYSFNRYAYGNNNPIGNIDPTGMFPDGVDGARMGDWGGWGNQAFWRDDSCAVCLDASSGVTDLPPVTVRARAPTAGAAAGGALGFVASLPVDFFEDFFTGGAGVVVNPATTAGMTAGGAVAGAAAQVGLQHGLASLAQMMSSNSPLGDGNGTPGSNQEQNKSFRDAVKEINHKLGRRISQDEERRLHDSISRRNYGYHDIVDEGLSMFHR